MNTFYEPQAKELAREIAEILNDRDAITMHLQYARRYNEAFLRKTLNKVMSLPPEKIKTSRARLYTFLINQNASYGDVRG